MVLTIKIYKNTYLIKAFAVMHIKKDIVYMALVHSAHTHYLKLLLAKYMKQTFFFYQKLLITINFYFV